MFFIICQLFLLNVASTTEERVVLSPVDPNAVANEPLCVLCNVHLKPGTFDISNVEFSIEPRVKKNLYLEQNITIINRSTASITYFNLSTLYNDAYITCSIKNFRNRNFSDQQHLHVGYRPSVPKIIPSYKVKNWSEFVFKWHFKFRNPVYNTIYHAWYKRPSDLDFTRCECIYKHECRECHIDDALTYVHPSGLLQFKVNGSNAVGNVTIKAKEENLYTLVQPQKIVILNVEILHRSAVVHLTFETSKQDRRSLHIRLLITCGTSYNKSYGYDLKWASCDRRTLSSLPPHSNCSVALRSKPLLNRKYWSDWAKETFESPDAVPLVNPSICHGCFEILPNSQDDHARGILLYFKPLEESESRGHVIRYNVSIAEDGKEGRVFNEIRNDSFYFEFYEMNWDAAYKISINAETRAGYNETLDMNEFLIPPQYEVLIPSEDFAMIALGKHEVRVFLQTMADKYTAVWCKWNNNRCIKPLNWKEIDVFSNNSTIDLENAKIYDYRFGMIRESKDGSLSGIQWTACIYNNSSDPEPPEMIIKEKTTRSVELHLKKRPCHNYDKVGYVFRYQILVSNLKCEVLQILTLNGSDDRIIVQDLEPGTAYNFKVSSVTMFGSLSKSVNESASTLSRPFFSESWHIGLMVCFGSIILCLIVGGVYACYRCNLDIVKRMKRWFKIGIDLPPKLTVREDGDGNTSSVYKLPRLFDDHLHKAEINVEGGRDWPEYKILLRLDTTPTESETTLSGSKTSSSESEVSGDPSGTKTNSNEHSNKSTSSVRLSTYGGGDDDEPEDESENYSKCMYQTNHSNMEFTVPEGPPLEFPPYHADGSDDPPVELGPRARSDPLGELGPAEDLGPTDINMNRSRCPADINQGRCPVSFDQLTWQASVSLCLGCTEDAQQHCPNDGFDVNSNLPGIRIARYPAEIDSTKQNESEISSWPHVVRDADHDDDDHEDDHDDDDDHDHDGVHNMTDEAGSDDTDSCDLEMDEYTHAKIHVEDGQSSSSTDVDSEHGSYSKAFPSQGVESLCSGVGVSSDDEDSAEYSRTSFHLLNSNES